MIAGAENRARALEAKDRATAAKEESARIKAEQQEAAAQKQRCISACRFQCSNNRRFDDCFNGCVGAACR